MRQTIPLPNMLGDHLPAVAWLVVDGETSLGIVRSDSDSPTQPSFVAGDPDRYGVSRSGFESVASAAAWLADPGVVPVPDWLDRLPGGWSQVGRRPRRRYAAA